LRRFAAWVCILALMLTIFMISPAQAESVRLRTKSSVSIRVNPASSARSLGTVKKGTVLTQVGIEGDWVKVTYRNDTGYVPKSSVTKVAEVKTDVIEVNGARMYKKASSSSAVMYTLKKGATVKVLSSSGGWVRVQYYNTTGYIQSKFFFPKETSSEPAVTPSPETTQKPQTSAKYKTEYVVLDGLVLFSSASSRSSRLAKLAYGTQVRVYGTQGNYKKVIVDGKKGYVPAKYLSAAAPGIIEDEEATPIYTQLAKGSEGAAVTALQERLIELGYLAGSADGIFGTKTQTAVKLYQSTVKLEATGIATAETQSSLFSTGAPEAPVVQPKPDEVIPNVTVKGVKAVDWFTSGIQNTFTTGSIVTVTDVGTGISWKVKRTGGWYHADAQPLTTEDTAKMLRACGSWSWERRPIWVTINGTTYAASMNCMPHGDSDSMPDNGFDGCFCIHFINSKVHGRNCVDADHQAAIAKALAAARG